MPFSIVAVNFDNYRQLPTAQHRWLLTCLARYADRDGRCWPSMRQLAVDARMSLATVCRYLRSMAQLGVFQRVRRGVGRYRYTLAAAYVPRWERRVSSGARRVPHQETRKNYYNKQDEGSVGMCHDDASRWDARLRAWRKSGFWLPQFGPKPGEAGYFGPLHFPTP
jgi:Fe2+ or Zn2+ uptake regulation protein